MGDCDYTTKTIQVFDLDTTKDNRVQNKEYSLARTLRHELIHAYLYESGLGSDALHVQQGHDEQYVDGMAYMYPHFKKTCDELGV